MKRKTFFPLVKCIAFLMMITMLLSLGTGIVYADDLDQENGEIVEDADPNGMYFITDLAIGAGDGDVKAEGHLKNAGYSKFVCWDAGTTENNKQANMNQDIYNAKTPIVGYKYATSIYAESERLRSDLITGLIVYDGANPPAQLQYKGKTYRPIEEVGGSNGDFNQGAGGAYLYLYYTNDGIENGDPVLTWLRARKPKDRDHSVAYVKRYTEGDDEDTKDHCLCQDMNAGAGGAYIYLEGDYHTHTLEDKYDENGHPYKQCKTCPFVKYLHDYTYTPIEKNPSYHKVHCTYNGCKNSFEEYHVDADGDGICDKCQAKGTVMADGYLFGKFPDAWNYALGQDGPVTIYILETVRADASEALHYIDKGEDITIERAPTASASSVLKVYKVDPFVVKNGSLTIKADVDAEPRSLKTVVSAVGPKAKVSIENSTIKVTDSKEGTVISAQEGANVNVSNVKIRIQNEDNQVTGIKVTGKDSSVTLSDVDIQGANCAVEIAQTKKATITNGNFDAKSCALRISNGAKATVKGGKFIGAECINATDGNITIDSIKVRGEFKSPSTVAELLPKDYGAFILDASEELYEGLAYRNLKVANYVFDKLSWIGKCDGHAILKVKSISDKEHEGHCEYCNMAVVLPHEFDENGKCKFCDAIIEGDIPGSGEQGGGSQNKNPDTGDSMTENIIWYEIMFAGATLVIAGTLLYLRKKKR